MSPINQYEAGIINTAIGALPGILALIRTEHTTANPGVPPPTDAEVIAALQSAIASSIAKDEAWKAAHPASQTDTGSDIPGGGASD